MFPHSSKLAAAASAVALAATLGSGAAHAAPATVSIDGNMQVLGLNVLHVDAQGTGDGPATGTYEAHARLGNMPLPIKVVGPVTCLTVRGDTVSLIYPITNAEPVMVFQPDAMAIQITVAKGTPNRIGYGVPMPTSSFKGCEPGPTPLVFDGTIDIS